MAKQITVLLDNGTKVKLTEAQAAELRDRCKGGSGRSDPSGYMVVEALWNRGLLDVKNRPTELGRAVAAKLPATVLTSASASSFPSVSDGENGFNISTDPHPHNPAPTLASIAAALSEALTALHQSLGRSLDRYEIFATMRDLAGTQAWDAMPISESVGAERLIWADPAGAAGAAQYLLVTPQGRCYVEGQTPADPIHAAEYLEIRRRFLAAHPPVDPPPPGSPEALQAQAAYDALTDRIAEGLANLTPAGDDATTTVH